MYANCAFYNRIAQHMGASARALSGLQANVALMDYLPTQSWLSYSYQNVILYIVRTMGIHYISVN